MLPRLNDAQDLMRVLSTLMAVRRLKDYEGSLL
jgi:hypothetical protein